MNKRRKMSKSLVERNAYLAKLGITPIWFEKGCFDYVESILRLAKNELRYRGLMPGTIRKILLQISQWVHTSAMVF